MALDERIAVSVSVGLIVGGCSLFWTVPALDALSFGVSGVGCFGLWLVMKRRGWSVSAVHRSKSCGVCQGSGVLRGTIGTPVKECHVCNGLGEVPVLDVPTISLADATGRINIDMKSRRPDYPPVGDTEPTVDEAPIYRRGDRIGIGLGLIGGGMLSTRMQAAASRAEADNVDDLTRLLALVPGVADVPAIVEMVKLSYTNGIPLSAFQSAIQSYHNERSASEMVQRLDAAARWRAMWLVISAVFVFSAGAIVALVLNAML